MVSSRDLATMISNIGHFLPLSNIVKADKSSYKPSPYLLFNIKLEY